MRRRLVLLLLPILLISAVPATASPGPRDEAYLRHEAAVAFWTADRIRAAVPRDMIFENGPGFVPAAKGGGNAKPTPTPTPAPTPTPTPAPGGTVTGASWESGGAALKGIGRVFFVMGAFMYSCSGSVVVDGRTGYSLVLTAGHCVIDKGRFATSWIFIPEYDTNPVASTGCANSTYGCWTARALFVHENFAAQKSFNTTAVTHDYAFALMDPGGKSGTASLEATVGGTFGITFSGPSSGTTLTALGYPAGSPYDGKQLTYCRGPIGQDPNTGNATWSMGCDMTGGSSGGGWLAGDPTTYGATLSSLNSYGYSGVQNMYGPKFNSRTKAVYDAANGTGTVNTRVLGG
jgi:V8-like Glu-specific endopeptidase